MGAKGIRARAGTEPQQQPRDGALFAVPVGARAPRRGRGKGDGSRAARPVRAHGPLRACHGLAVRAPLRGRDQGVSRSREDAPVLARCRRPLCARPGLPGDGGYPSRGGADWHRAETGRASRRVARRAGPRLRPRREQTRGAPDPAGIGGPAGRIAGQPGVRVCLRSASRIGRSRSSIALPTSGRRRCCGRTSIRASTMCGPIPGSANWSGASGCHSNGRSITEERRWRKKSG